MFEDTNEEIEIPKEPCHCGNNATMKVNGVEMCEICAAGEFRYYKIDNRPSGGKIKKKEKLRKGRDNFFN